jgi:hypothetical protein
VRSARASLLTFWLYQTVTLEVNEVRPDCVVGELKLISDLIDRPVSGPEQIQHLATCAFEQSRTPS